MIISTSSVEAAHDPLVIVQRKVAVPDAAKPVTPEVGELGVLMVAVPEITVQLPVPVAGVFPANVAVVPSHVAFISVPAADTVGTASTVTEVVLAPVDEPQVLLVVSV